MDAEALTAAQVDEVFNISRSTLFALCAKGEGPPSFKVGGKRLWLRSSILKWMKECEGHVEHRGYRRRRHRFIKEFCSRFGVTRKRLRTLLDAASLPEFVFNCEARQTRQAVAVWKSLIKEKMDADGGGPVDPCLAKSMTEKEWEDLMFRYVRKSCDN